ncbi:MAG TPA: hypothetical protein VFQ75_11880 [Candidatus Limnocylindrales bacterium]|jgi:hypothetical protein|nr:hypothetical protein [Candidatus Limnocylindrales bacterium]
MPTTREPRTIVAITGEDDRFDAIRSRATALADGADTTVILYDIDAAGMFASPVPTEWSGDGQQELMDEEASNDRLDADALETAGRGAIATQVRSLRAMGIDAWGWLPTRRDTADLAAYATRQGASLVLVPVGMAPADAPDSPRFESVE